MPLAAAHFFYYAGWADKLEYAFPGPEALVRSASPARLSRGTSRCSWRRGRSRPPWPAGNTVVLKPAETTPLTAAMQARRDHPDGGRAADGVVNIVHGAGETGAIVVQHPDVDKVAFTGSTEVGKQIQRALAGTGKRLHPRARRQGANIIFEDAAIDQAVEGIVNGIFFNQGHVCCAGSRLLVQESVADEVISTS